VTILPYRGRTPTLGRGVFVAPGSWLIGDLVIGESSSVWFNVTVRADVHFIRIGRRTNIQDHAMIHVGSENGPTRVGDEVTVGHGVILHGCAIGDRCLVGMGAVILNNAVVPDGCIVAAGALIPPGKAFPREHLLLGSPAKALRKVTAEELGRIRDSAAKYVALAAEYRAGGATGGSRRSSRA